jgi:hypothetical protein
MSSYSGSINCNTSASFSYSPPSPTGLSIGIGAHQSPRDQHNMYSQFGVLTQGSSGQGSGSQQGFGSLKKFMGRK